MTGFNVITSCFLNYFL
uniref:Uncharacterized protein n=1 Tax=Arundo donax TaxID=35708 RepID=A0A0A8YZU6_ARUDO